MTSSPTPTLPTDAFSPEIAPQTILELDSRAWLESMAEGKNQTEMAVIWHACEYLHSLQTETFTPAEISYALAVADVLAKLHMDHETISAAILYHALLHHRTTLDAIQTLFGERIARLVHEVEASGILWALPQNPDSPPQAEKLRQMLVAMVEDARVILIVLAERLQKMRTLASESSARKQWQLALETMDIFAPLANRLGIWQIKWELEDLAFRYLEPDAYLHIATLLAESRTDRECYMQKVMDALQQALKHAHIEAKVSGRPKHLYSIWRKMQRKKVDFSQIYDVRAVRIMVNTLPECYAALGVVHTLYRHIPKEFDDYIANPKGNHYQSLHTAVFGPEGKSLEIQIRTAEMHQQAELGVAAHWRYKEGAKEGITNQPGSGFQQKIAWLRHLLEWKGETTEGETDDTDFLDRFKSEVLQDRIYVFTPKGKIIDLPKGATPLDFAYYVHTNVGHHCRGARVDGRIVNLTYILKTGQQVEILTDPNGKPSHDWMQPYMGYLYTARARARVRLWFRQQSTEQSLQNGQALLDQQLRRIGSPKISVETLAQRFKMKDVNAFLIALGRHDILPPQLASEIQKLSPTPAPELPILPAQRVRQKRSKTGYGVEVRGVDNLLTHLSKCCKPLPPDPIIGYITHQHHGVAVHRMDCPQLVKMSHEHKERLIEVEWNHHQDTHYLIDIQIKAHDRRNLLLDITSILAQEKVNVVASQSARDKEDLAHLNFSLEVKGLSQLSTIMERISKLPSILDVKRKL